MERLDNIIVQVPPRIRVAFAYLTHARMITWAPDPALPVRALTTLEQSVHSAALRAVQQYLLGEMDFAEPDREEKPARKPAIADAKVGKNAADEEAMGD